MPRPRAPGNVGIKCVDCEQIYSDAKSLRDHRSANCRFRPDAPAPKVASEECLQLARAILPNPPQDLLIERNKDEAIVDYRLRAVEGVNLHLLAIFKLLGIPDFANLIHVGLYGPSPVTSNPFLLELQQIRTALLVHLGVGPTTVAECKTWSAWRQIIQYRRKTGKLEPSPTLSPAAKDFVAGNRGSASHRVVGKVKNPFADLTSGASRIVGPLLDFYGVPFSSLSAVLAKTFNLVHGDHVTGVARMLAAVAAYTMNINGQNALCYLRQVYCAQGDDPEAPLPETNVYFASRNFFPGTPQGKMALRLLFEAAKDLNIDKPLARAAYALGADRKKYPFIGPLRKAWLSKVVDAFDGPWTHPGGSSGFAVLMGVAWDPMRAVGSHWRGEWTLEEFDTIERLKATHSYGYIARQLGRTYNAVTTAACYARNGGIRITAHGERDLAKLAASDCSSSTSSSSTSSSSTSSSSTSSSSTSSSSTSSSSLSSSSVPRKRKAATPSSSTPSSPGGSSADISSRPTKKIKTAQPAEHAIRLTDD